MLKLALALTLVAAIRAADPVAVAVYYESLCPDSKNFIANQLWPAYQQVAEIFNVTFVPFGFANFTANGQGYDFTCQHGPNECYGNKIHSCALNYYPNNADNVPFICCSMSADDPVAASEECANQYNLDWTEIYNCANSDFGSQLLEANGIITESLSPSPTWMPWIILNDVYSDGNEIMAQTDFLKLICTTYEGTPPAECP